MMKHTFAIFPPALCRHSHHSCDKISQFTAQQMVEGWAWAWEWGQYNTTIMDTTDTNTNTYSISTCFLAVQYISRISTKKWRPKWSPGRPEWSSRNPQVKLIKLSEKLRHVHVQTQHSSWDAFWFFGVTSRFYFKTRIVCKAPSLQIPTGST